MQKEAQRKNALILSYSMEQCVGNSAENRVLVELGFQFNPELQSTPKAPDQSRKVLKTSRNWICSRKTDQEGGGIFELEKLQNFAGIAISPNPNKLFVHDFFCDLQERRSKLLAVE